jgi:TonB-linked SusC/RagA family outer membrane protein
MRKFITILTVALLSFGVAVAQTRLVTGKLTDKDGTPVPFATIKVKGTGTGLSADAIGTYTIKAKEGDILQISGAGLKSIEIVVGKISIINTIMEKGSSAELAEVVVSGGYGIKRSLKTASSNVQVVTGEKLNTIRNTNINDALAGKVAGIQVRSQSGAALGRTGTIRLFGESALGGGSTVLYVMDGTRVLADDINTDDVEDVTVLQGPSAAAIFGPDGANGAIIVTTKRAKKGAKGMGIEMNLGTRFENVYILPNYQNSYAGGDFSNMKKYNYQAGQPAEWKALDGKYYPDYSEDVSWGPRMVGQEYIPWYAWYGGHSRSFKTALLTPQPNNARDFYNTQIKNNNSITFSKATDLINTRITFNNVDVKGLIPTTYLKKNSLNTSTTVDLNSHFTLGLNFNYYNQKTNGDFNDNYANQSSGSFNQWFHRDLDMGIVRELKDLRTPGGVNASWNHNGPDNYNPANLKDFYGPYYWQNFYSSLDQITNLSNVNKLFGDASLTYKINNDFKIKGTYRTVRYSGFSESKASSDLADMKFSSQATGFIKGGYSSSTFNNTDQDIEAIGMYNKSLKDFVITGSAGLDLHSYFKHSNYGSTRDGFNTPNLYALSNSKSTPIVFDERYAEKDNAIFVTGQVGFRKFLNADFTLRNDWLSVFPKNKNDILSKSVGGSFVFSEFLKEKVPFLSFGKIRVAWGETPQSFGDGKRTSGAYTYPGSLYFTSTDQWNGNFLMYTNSTKVDSAVHGAVASQKEIGIDLSFLKNRIGISATYKKAISKGFPQNKPITGTSGTTSFLTNVGEIDREALDLQFNVKPLMMKNIKWELNATFSRLIHNKVVDIDGDPTTTANIAVEGTVFGPVLRAIEGEEWGTLYGNGIKRDAAGNAILNTNGTYVYDANTKLGNVLPKLTGGVQNSFVVLQNFTVNVNIDYQVGGKFFSLSDYFGAGTGVLARSAGINDKGIPERDPVAEGGGHKVSGVDLTTGKAVAYYLAPRDYFNSANNTFENNIYDLTFVKLREVSVGYNIPINKLGLEKYFTRANLSIIASNPWLIYAKTRDFDPSEIRNQSGETGQFPGIRGFGFNLKVGF